MSGFSSGSGALPTAPVMEEELNETEYYKVFNCTSDPSAAEMFTFFEHNPSGLVCLIIATVITAVQTVVMVDGIVWISKNIPHAERSSSMIWIYSVWPVFCLVSLCGLYIPKAALLSNAGANMFLYPTLYNYLALIVDYFGGEDGMVGKMKGHPIKYSQPPLLCCCCCCPRSLLRRDLKRNHFTRLEWLVMQIAVVRPLLLFLSQLLIIDGSFRLDNMFDYRTPALYLQVLNVLSTMLAMQVLGTLNSSCKEHLKQYSTMSKFLVVQFALLMCNVQTTVVNFILNGFGGCGNPYPYKSRDYVWNCFLIILESLIFQPICVRYLRTLKGNVLFIPEKLVKSSSEAAKKQTAMKTAARKALLETATEATELDGDLEKTPLIVGAREKTRSFLRRTRSHSELRETYGSVMTV